MPKWTWTVRDKNKTKKGEYSIFPSQFIFFLFIQKYNEPSILTRNNGSRRQRQLNRMRIQKFLLVWMMATVRCAFRAIHLHVVNEINKIKNILVFFFTFRLIIVMLCVHTMSIMWVFLCVCSCIAFPFSRSLKPRISETHLTKWCDVLCTSEWWKCKQTKN